MVTTRKRARRSTAAATDDDEAAQQLRQQMDKEEEEELEKEEGKKRKEDGEHEESEEEEEEEQDDEQEEDEQEEELEEELEQEHKEDFSPAAKRASKAKSRGVVYVGRPPAYMKPAKVRHVFQQYGAVTNLYLAPEDASVRKRRKTAGGSSKIKYSEGWVEFADKKVAKMLALSLNGKPVGGNRRSFHYSDLWSLKYLRGFKWAHLSEKQAYERRTKTAKLHAEASQAKRENEQYLESVAKHKKIERAIKARSDGTNEKPRPKEGALPHRGFKQLTSRKAYLRDGKGAKGHAKPAAPKGKGASQWLTDVFS